MLSTSAHAAATHCSVLVIGSGTLKDVTYTGAVDLSAGGFLTFQGGTLNTNQITLGNGAALILDRTTNFTGVNVALDTYNG